MLEACVLFEWLYVIVLVASMLVSALLTGHAWFQRDTALGCWFFMVSLLSILVIVSYLFFSISEQESVAFLFVQIRLTVLSFSPLVFLLFLSVFTGYGHWLWRYGWRLLLVIPMITTGLIWFSPDLIWESWEITSRQIINIESPVYTGWFFVHALYGFALTIFGSVYLLRLMMTGTPPQRRQALTILPGLLIPLTVVALPTLGLTNGLPNPYPISLTVMVAAFAWVLYRQQLLTLSPLAYQNIIDNMLEAVLVIDRDGRLALFNESAKHLFSLSETSNVIGHPVQRLIGSHSEALVPHLDDRDAHFEGYLSVGDEARIFDVNVSPIYNNNIQTDYRLFVLHDITERKQMEDRLHHSEATVRAMLNSTTQSFTLIDRDKRVVDADEQGKRSAERIFGKRLETGASIYDFVLPRDHESFTQHFQRALCGEMIRLEKSLPTADSNLLYFEIVYYPVIDNDGAVIGVCMSHQDITERKQMEEELTRNVIDLELAQRIASVGNWTFDPEVGVPVWSNEVYKIYERDPRSGPPRLEDYREIYEEEDFDRFWTAIQAAISEGKPYDIKLNLSLPDGKQKWIHAICEPEPKRGSAGHLLRGTIQDVSKIHYAQEALRESEARFRQLAENIEAVFWLIDVESDDYLYVSPAYDIIWQRSHLDLIEKGSDAFVTTLHPEDRDWAMQGFSDWLMSVREAPISPTETAYKIEHRIVRPSGEVRSVQSHFFAVRNKSGDVYRVAVITQDITAKKKAEQREFELSLELERRRILTTFFQDAAHEFRTPLAIIGVNTYMISQSDDAEHRVQIAEQIETNINRVTQLIDSLLLMTRLENNAPSTDNLVDVGDILQSVCRKVERTYPQHHTLHYDVAKNLSTTFSDAVYLSDALQQVVDNAFRFTPAGGEISVKAKNVEDCIQIEIRDNGPGILADDLPHIFETFWRKDTAHSTPGFGLGLPIAQKIIEQYGGKINVESEAGQGTTVRISLPVRQNA